MVVDPETYRSRSNAHAPNSSKPVLIYKDCLPLPLSESKVKESLESRAWIQGGTWGHIPQRHLHPNTHECYGVLHGESTLLLGCGHDDKEEDGQKVDVRAGDVIVLPAGTGHCNLQSSNGFRYIGVYPEGAPKWQNELGKAGTGVEMLRKEAESVALPTQDPVNGVNGPLVTLWA